MFMSTISGILRALGCPARLGVYQCLGEQGKPVSQVARELSLAQSTTSFHLAKLMAAGLVDLDVRGREHHYRWGRRRWFLVEGAL
ncbi:MAG: hypothetical protein AMXMBFR56_53280 [Polyangiaceae bacterium]